jgi:hypothetical protein
MCPRERDVWEAISRGTWPSDDELRAHADGCAVCRDIVAVTEPLVAERAAACAEAAPPSAAIVWWRAQARARQEAARAATQPITVVHAVAIACGAGLLAAGATVWARGWHASLVSVGPAVGNLLAGLASLDTRWTTLLVMLAAWILIAPLVAYLVLRED